LNLSEIWNYREVILYTSILELKVKYKGTFLGFIWSVLEPLAQLAILFAVFSFLYSSDESFVIYLFLGLIMVQFFSRGTTHAMNSLIIKKPILTSLDIPKILFPLSSVLTHLWMFFIEIIIFFVFVVIFQQNIGVTALFILPIFGLLIILTTGISLIISVLMIHIRDFQTLWGIVTLSLIFITPVFWYVDDMPTDIANIFLLNPLALLMEMAHESIIFNEIPTTFEFSYAIGSTIAILFVGYFLFKKTEKKLVENL